MIARRRRKQIETMQTTQRTAMELFEQRGFDAVTVAEVAAASGVAASTVYRHFETKEALLLWDEHDDEISAALEVHLRSDLSPIDAIRTAFIETLGARYDESDSFQLRRVRSIYATEQVHAAALEADMRDRTDLADGVAHFLPRRRRDAAPVIAGVAMATLDVAIDRWQQANGARSLVECITEAFEHLAELDL